MRVVKDTAWKMRGFSLLWEAEILREIGPAEQVLSMRSFFELSRQWPEELPGSGGRTLMVAGLEGCLDVLAPPEAEQWLAENFVPLLLSFQGEYQGQAGLVLWLASGRSRIGMQRATGTYQWHCAAPHSKEKVDLGRILWSGAESDVERILVSGHKNPDPDGAAWAGLHLPRIS